MLKLWARELPFGATKRLLQRRRWRCRKAVLTAQNTTPEAITSAEKRRFAGIFLELLKTGLSGCRSRGAHLLASLPQYTVYLHS